MPLSEFRQRWILTALSALLVAWVLFTIFGERGVVHIKRLKDEKRILDERNVLLQKENEVLRERVRRLRHDDRYLEKIAREDLGLVRQGEIVYRFAPTESRKRSRSFTDSSSELPRSSAQTRRP